MRIEVLKNERISYFIDYCRRHKLEVDDSFLYDEDFRDFKPDDENPTYIAVDEAGRLVAAASLIINEYQRRGKKGRFRIFHSEVDDFNCYDMLMQAILKHRDGLDKYNIFVPMTNKKLMEFMEKLQFNVERYAFLLVREDLEVPDINLPGEYEIRPYRKGVDEETWCAVRNPSFATLRGSETPMTPEQVAKMMAAEDDIEGGSMILYHKDKPVGVVRGSEDEYEGSPTVCIGPLAIIPEYQGMGLGRCLLRASLLFAKEKGFKRTYLSVNGENERAQALYLQEGFKQVEAVVCYKYDLTV